MTAKFKREFPQSLMQRFPRTSSVVSPRRVDPDNVQVAEVDALFIVPAAAGAAFGPDAVWRCSLSRQLCPL